ncbi:unnamed protein product [Notodromas monacha]|uniref:Kinesin-like protein 6 n=1 Tax=Notodromas monacha TaxID=399045 RepID=A0A7R9BR32_9CRUS|nr:unnamed protein product [Notodromas monacha]CAG0919052.1 unnamed protein product [Notodromas monacha]
MTEENVKVAVRVRPFNSRELARNAKCIVEMNGKITQLRDPNNPNAEPKPFSFDYSYWSFDGCKEAAGGYFEPDSSQPNGGKYADQQLVFDDLGEGILKNALEGYNATIFAYGQTGSGKSWSIIGYGKNKGLVPMFCEALFAKIKENQGNGVQYEVKFSMLEIYNEVVHDLLNPAGKKGGLKIRENNMKGFYAEGLKTVLVTSYEDIAAKMEEGTRNRTVAATNMNATSSRAHTIVAVHFVQKTKNAAGQETAKTSVVNLVDLAGSERVESTGATGARLKEGASINQSLSCLGNCIHALAENSQGKKVRVPYRDSALTKLLMNALGGNSKTIMVAAISPADINYEETLSTLRYADRAKQIKTTAVVNESATDKLLRELKEENERLKKMMVGGVALDAAGPGPDASDSARKKWEEELKAQMRENEREIQEMKKSYEEKLKQAEAEAAAAASQRAEAKTVADEKVTNPHFINLNPDPQLSGKLVYIIHPGSKEIGNRKGKESDIVIVGPSINETHAIVTLDPKKNIVNLKPFNTDCRILVNGSEMAGETTLCHNDRIVFGFTQLWVFQNPKEAAKSGKKFVPITYEYAQEEIAAKQGLDVSATDASADAAALQDEIMEVLPAVEEANSISGQLDKRAKFEIMIVSPQMMGKTNGRSEVCVKMKDLGNGTEFVWPKEKFFNRLYLMREMYNNFDDDDDEWDVPQERDPFREDPEEEVLIGSVNLFLQPISYMVEMKEQLDVLDFKGKIGVMNDIYCSYKVYLDEIPNITTKAKATSNPDFNHEKLFRFNPVTKQVLDLFYLALKGVINDMHLFQLTDYLHNGEVIVQVFGKQRVRNSATPRGDGLSTKDMLKGDKAVFSKSSMLMNGFEMNGRDVDPQKQGVIVELLLLKKTQAKLQCKVDNVKQLLEHCDNQNRVKVPVSTLKDVFNANSPEATNKLLSALPGDEGLGRVEPVCRVEVEDPGLTETDDDDGLDVGDLDVDDPIVDNVDVARVDVMLEIPAVDKLELSMDPEDGLVGTTEGVGEVVDNNDVIVAVWVEELGMVGEVTEMEDEVMAELWFLLLKSLLVAVEEQRSGLIHLLIQFQLVLELLMVHHCFQH